MHFKDTGYGFEWGAATVTRVCSDEKQGWVVLEIATPKKIMEIYVTKTGKMEITKLVYRLPQEKTIENCDLSPCQKWG